ncbi:hypothetical protein [Paenibacillus sp. MMO-58]|uniref:hypothetical protein n=1 Tax=Paenibacillus sp. MMO-58 TaxID=3081290 RepID=UPI003016C55E
MTDSRINEAFKLLVREYEKMTGFKDMHHNAIMHHRISMYGNLAKNAESRCARRKQKCAWLAAKGLIRRADFIG